MSKKYEYLFKIEESYKDKYCDIYPAIIIERKACKETKFIDKDILINRVELPILLMIYKDKEINSYVTYHIKVSEYPNVKVYRGCENIIINEKEFLFVIEYIRNKYNIDIELNFI